MNKFLSETVFFIKALLVLFAFLFFGIGVCVNGCIGAMFGTQSEPRFSAKVVSVVWQDEETGACAVFNGEQVYSYTGSERLSTGSSVTLTCFTSGSENGMATSASIDDVFARRSELRDIRDAFCKLTLLNIVAIIVIGVIKAIVAGCGNARNAQA